MPPLTDSPIDVLSVTTSARIDATESRARARDCAALSLLVPGLGQLAQHRIGTAILHFGTVAVYLVAAFGLGGRRVYLLALLWNVWSVIDAYRHEVE